LVEVCLNGQAIGELGMNAAVAGAHGVPVVLVTGDQAMTEEARALLGDVEAVAVKQSLTRTAARSLHPEVAQQRIRQAAQRALDRSVAPLALAAPITLRLVFHRALHADMAELVPGSRRVDGRTVEWTGEDMVTTYRTFQAMVSLAYAV
jgi:D-amino peptidase